MIAKARATRATKCHSVLTHPARAGRTSLTTDHARNCLYAHTRKSIHRTVAYSKQLALYNHHEYITSQTYLIVLCMRCDSKYNIIVLLSRFGASMTICLPQSSNNHRIVEKKNSRWRGRNETEVALMLLACIISQRASCRLADSICRGAAASGAPNTAR